MRDEGKLWCFLQKPGLPLTNIEAERALRPYVIFRKTSFFSQSARGDQFRPLILSLTGTCKRQKIPLYPLLRIACAQGIRGEGVSVRLPLPQNQLLLDSRSGTVTRCPLYPDFRVDEEPVIPILHWLDRICGKPPSGVLLKSIWKRIATQNKIGLELSGF